MVAKISANTNVMLEENDLISEIRYTMYSILQAQP